MLINFKSHAGGLVTFGDGAQSKIEGVSTIMIDGLLVLKNVLFVVDFKANLISVGQLCND